jgi:F-type H+-transporting ATPase subunit delta
MNHSENISTDSSDGAGHFHADVSAQRIAKVYAESLLDAAAQRNATDELLEELRSLVGDVFRASPDLERVLSGATVGRDRKAQLIHSTFDGRASESFVHFLLVLNDHDRLELLRPILAAAEELNDQRKKRVRVKVQTAVPLPEDQREQLTRELRTLVHGEPILETEVDPDLLGGLVVRFHDWLYDNSVRTQLQTIRNQLIERSSHEIQSGRDRFYN